jgi:ribonuclease BN (tRNA processing enzyme)
MEVRTDRGSVIIIDAGTGIRRLGNLLLAENRNRYTMLFTHVHWDHIIGLPFFRPLFLKNTHLSIMGCPFLLPSFLETISPIMKVPYFPVDIENVKADIGCRDFCQGTIRIDGMVITSIPLSHPNGGIGFRFEENGRSFVYLTDNELGYQHPGGMAYDDYREFSKGADLLVHDAEYLPGEYRKTKKWGHSAYTEALQLAIDAGVSRLGLFHHNQDRTDEALDQMVEECRKAVADHAIDCFALTQDTEIIL